MSEAYRVRVTSGSGKDRSAVLQVIAESPAEAETAVRNKVGADTRVEADVAPISAEEARQSGVIPGKVLLG